MRHALERDGFVLLPAIEASLLARFDELTRSITPDDRRGGLREPQRKIDGLSQLAEDAGLHDLARQLLKAETRPVRWILFDKTSSSNWLVPWHRDTTICVRERADVDEFGPWSVKDGRVHVQPPLRVLRGMVTLRLHIDEANASNGALRVIPGSHYCEQIDDVHDDANAVLIEAEPGVVLGMKPLVMHASSKATDASRRRILHIEYASEDLPHPLRWG